MSDPRGPRSNRPASRRPSDATGNGGVAAEAATSTMKGIVLILVAIAIGIVLLNVVDDGNDAPTSSGGDKKTTTTQSVEGSTTTTEAPTTLTPHNEIKIQVLNGGSVQGAAGAMTDQLKGKGYTDAADAADAADREGNVVACVAGLEREAAELATLVGSAEVLPAFPDPAPDTMAAGVECLVILGSPKAGDTSAATTSG